MLHLFTHAPLHLRVWLSIPHRVLHRSRCTSELHRGAWASASLWHHTEPPAWLRRKGHFVDIEYQVLDAGVRSDAAIGATVIDAGSANSTEALPTHIEHIARRTGPAQESVW